MVAQYEGEDDDGDRRQFVGIFIFHVSSLSLSLVFVRKEI